MASKEIVVTRTEESVVNAVVKWAGVYAHILSEFHNSLDESMDPALKSNLTCIYFTEILLHIGDEIDPNNRDDQ